MLSITSPVSLFFDHTRNLHEQRATQKRTSVLSASTTACLAPGSRPLDRTTLLTGLPFEPPLKLNPAGATTQKYRNVLSQTHYYGGEKKLTGNNTEYIYYIKKHLCAGEHRVTGNAEQKAEQKAKHVKVRQV